MHNLTTSDVKNQNKSNILKFIYTNRTTTQQMICEQLNLSRPTVIRILKELEEEGSILKDGFFESTGGRKATALTFSSSSHIAIGVEILKHSYEIVALNLYGEILKSETHNLTFKNKKSYFLSLCTSITSFINTLNLPNTKVLGIGIALQGLISSDGHEIVYGKILDCTGLTIEQFTKHLPYPCMFVHDAESAALSELWISPQLQNAIFINIRHDISGAIVVNRTFLPGRELKSGVFEHMQIVPDGKPCYCGQHGCFNAYCSTNALLSSGESLESFFQGLRRKESDKQERWHSYLHYLSLAINNLHMFTDFDIILGGTLARYLSEEDLDLISDLVFHISAFPTNRRFIKLSRNPDFPISRGAALPYIQGHLLSMTKS